MSTTDELILSCDPFAGDFGEPSDHVFSDKMVVARRPGPCHLCGTTILPGERIRRRSERFDGSVETFRWCATCCAAMAASWEDDGFALEARHRLREFRALEA